jgi:hypothetical protein
MVFPFITGFHFYSQPPSSGGGEETLASVEKGEKGMGEDDLQGDRAYFHPGGSFQIDGERDFISRQPDNGTEGDMVRLLGRALSDEWGNGKKGKKKDGQGPTIFHDSMVIGFRYIFMFSTYYIPIGSWARVVVLKELEVYDEGIQSVRKGRT